MYSVHLNAILFVKIAFFIFYTWKSLQIFKILTVWIKVIYVIVYKGLHVFSPTVPEWAPLINSMQMIRLNVKILLTGAEHSSQWLPFFVRTDRNHFTYRHEAKFGLFRTICVNLWDSWDVIELPISNLTSRMAFQVIKLYHFYPFNCMRRYCELSFKILSWDWSDPGPVLPEILVRGLLVEEAKRFGKRQIGTSTRTQSRRPRSRITDRKSVSITLTNDLLDMNCKMGFLYEEYAI